MGVKAPTKENKLGLFTFKPDTTYICVKSTSNAYTEGEEYTVYLNEQGHKCIKGDDGLEDFCAMLVSSFKEKL